MRTELDRIAENNYAREEGLRQGLEQGLEQGQASMRKEVIRKFLVFGLSPEDIAKALEIPEEEVLSLKEG